MEVTGTVVINFSVDIAAKSLWEDDMEIVDSNKLLQKAIEEKYGAKIALDRHGHIDNTIRVETWEGRDK